MIGDRKETHLQPVPDAEILHYKLQALLDLADEMQQLWMGSYVAVHVLVEPDDLIVREGRELSDRRDLYSVVISKKERLP